MATGNYYVLIEKFVRPEVRKCQTYHMNEVIEEIRNNVKEAILFVFEIFQRIFDSKLKFQNVKMKILVHYTEK